MKNHDPKTRLLLISLALCSLAPIALRAQADMLPQSTGFELTEGFQLGDLDGQQGWTTTGEPARIVYSPSLAGFAAIELPADANSWAVHQFRPKDSSQLYVSFFAKPNMGFSAEEGTQFIVDGAGFAFVNDDGVPALYLYNFQQNEPGHWQKAAANLPIANTTGVEWLHITVRLDYEASQWDMTINGEPMVAAQPLDSASNASGFLMMSAGLGGSAQVDDLKMSETQPEFPAQNLAFRNMLFGREGADGKSGPPQSASGNRNTASALQIGGTTTTSAGAALQTSGLGQNPQESFFEIFSPN